MALKQSSWALGNNQSKRPQTSGALHVQRFIYNIPTSAYALAAADIVEIGELPPFCRIIDAKIYTNGTFTGITADVGLLSGEYGDATDGTRTSSNEIFAAADLTTMTRLSKSDSLKIAPIEASRGIGVKVSGTVGNAADKYIVLELHYTQ